jgi:hypothetical protein
MKTITTLLVASALFAATLALASCDEDGGEDDVCCDCRCTGTGPSLALCSKTVGVPLGDHPDCRTACTHDGCEGVCIVLTASEVDCD